MPIIVNLRGPLIPSDVKWVYDFFEIESICPNDISKAIDEASEKSDSIIFRINSTGGCVSVGADIYEMIRSSDIETEARIVGDCCSAATYIACAADKATMSPLAQYMIHRCSVSASGNSSDFAVVLQMLNETDRAIASAYAMKTGMSEEEIIELMNKETFMNAQTAKKLGFIDSVLFENEFVQNSIDTNKINILNASNCMIDESVINQMQKNKQSILSAQNSVKKREVLAKLNLLKLGGRVDE
jgi:ATP-dependent protease ClpP protease subunit|nr:MAG TPA_asm: Putative ATP dependent Clp protease [Caudoviricetes sp.]